MILVLLDGTPFGEHALPMALAIARRTGATLALAHTHQLVITAALPGGAPAFDLTFDALIREQEENYLSEIAGRVAAV
jgi:nucleotide-binding universal stress UspA family protein